MDEIKIDTNQEGMLPGLRKTLVKDDGTAIVIEGRRNDFAVEVYDDSFSFGGGGLPAIRTKADRGVWAIIQLWQDTYKRIRGVAYVIPCDAKKYELYGKVKRLVEAFGYDGVRSLARAYWTLPRWENYERTIDRFCYHAQSVYEALQRGKRDE